MGIGQEIKELRIKMNEAIAQKDGWLTHWYGSQIQSYQKIKQDSEERSKKRMRKYQDIKERCELNAQILYDSIVFAPIKPWWKKYIG